MDDASHLRAERRIQTVCLAVLSAVAVGAALYWLRPVLIPFILALFIAYSITPVVDFLRRHLHCPRYVALFVAFLIGFVVVALFALMVSSTIQEIAGNVDQYKEQFGYIINVVIERLPLEKLGFDPDDLAGDAIQRAKGLVGGVIGRLLGEIGGLMSNGAMVLIFMFFLLIGEAKPATADRGVLGGIERSIRRYIVMKFAISAVTGVAHGFVLWLLGVKFAFMFGFFAFLLNFIPNIGPLIAMVVHIPVLPLTVGATVPWAIVAVAAPAAVQFVSGNVVEPRVMGQSLDLHPVVILLALIFFGMIWGVVGMFLATPIAAAVKICFEKIDFFKPAANILAGRLDDLRRDDEPSPAVAFAPRKKAPLPDLEPSDTGETPAAAEPAADKDEKDE